MTPSRRTFLGTSSLLPRFLSLCALGVAALAFTVLTAAPAAAAGSPQWQVELIGQPTNFDSSSSEDGYFIKITNVGDAPSTNAPIVVSDTLPIGVTATSLEFITEFANEPQLCTTVPLRCEYTVGKSIPGKGPLPRVQPGDSMLLLVRVAVSAEAMSPLTNSVSVSGGGVLDTSASTTNYLSSASPPFGFQGFELSARNRDASPFTQAGAHPYQLNLSAYLNTNSDVNRLVEATSGGGTYPLYFPVEEPRDISVDFPPGLIGNPLSVPRCTLAKFWAEGCPASSQIGTVTVNVNAFRHSTFPGVFITTPFYNLAPEVGHAASFGFLVFRAIPFILSSSVRTGGSYAVQSIQEGIAGVLPTSFSLTLWGVPADPRHDPQRGQECGLVTGTECEEGGLSSGISEPRPFLTMPTNCTAASPTAEVSADSWQSPGVFQGASASMPATDGCEAVPFEPTLEAQPTTTHADSPSGLDVDLHIPQQEESPEGVATSDLKDATVTLPAGIKVNPSSAAGLKGCSEAQIGYRPATTAPLEFSPGHAECPDASKLGKVEIDTPLLDHPLPGAVYLAQPNANPFGSLLALYIVIDDPLSGVIVKLAGKVIPDPHTGQLSATFEENPQLPFEDFHLHFFPGAQGALRTPATCATFTTTAALTPWSAPTAPSTPSDQFAVTGPAQGGSCPHSATEEENAPRFHAGTESPQAGIYSPFSLRLVREDGSQELAAIDTTLPPGLSGKLAGIPYCPPPALAAASNHSGAAEQAAPSCPAASQVGSVEVGAGAGPDPFYVTGQAYLAGPYKGAPLSLAIITPALAGPFDLGTVVVRTALYVNPETAQIHAVSDPIPTILQGIPLDVRSVTLKMNRPNFTLNPTSCNELAFSGSALSALGAATPLTERFQLAGCATLPFKPKLALSLKGATHRTGHPALKAVLTMPPGNANIARAQVTLPPSELLDNAHLNNICTKVQFAANQCPASSVYGHARAITPLLDAPLEGPVYLRSAIAGHNLPDLVADLGGQIEVALVGKVDTGKGGGLRNTFEAVPDAPVSKFVLEMQGAGKGLIQNSTNICARPQRAVVAFTAQNGKLSDTEPKVKVSCPKHGKGKHPAKPHRHGGHR
jgi:hypothetical protein